jgi:hypothetical protein
MPSSRDAGWARSGCDTGTVGWANLNTAFLRLLAVRVAGVGTVAELRLVRLRPNYMAMGCEIAHDFRRGASRASASAMTRGPPIPQALSVGVAHRRR